MNVRQIFAIIAGGLAVVALITDHDLVLLAVAVLLLAAIVLIKEP